MQKKEQKTIAWETITQAVEFFLPQTDSRETLHIDFYGGEPLLAFNQVRFAMELITAKCWRRNQLVDFTLTTNGSLLTDPMLEFFNRYQFHLILSFDGLAQDFGRKPHSLTDTLETVKRIHRYPGIQLEINSVFTPKTISVMTESVQFMINYGLIDITLNFSGTDSWQSEGLDTLSRELDKLCDYLAAYKQRTGVMPVSNFRGSETGGGIFRCSAGQHQIAVSPMGEIWGCALFHDYFKQRKQDSQYEDYNLGNVYDVCVQQRGLEPRTIGNYMELRQNLFSSEDNPCFLCSSLNNCCVCPVNAAYSTQSIGLISTEKCRINRIVSAAQKRFYRHCREAETGHAC
jgi:sulfatase maturation enzyme AslB (radical SAM superfamily)